MTEQAVSPLRRRMIEDMSIRKFAGKTQHDYVQRIKELFTGAADLAGRGDVAVERARWWPRARAEARPAVVVSIAAPWPVSTRSPMSRSVRSCTTLTRWRRLRRSRSSFQTTSVSPARSALRHASSPGRSIGQGADDHRRCQGMAGVAGLPQGEGTGLSARIVDDATVGSPCACTSR
jgi:hypothetical protein